MASELETLFNSFCAFGAGAGAGKVHEMDNAKFAKFTRDCKLLDKKLTPASVDITFNKVKEKTARKINFKQFDQACHFLAEAKGVSYGDFVSSALSVGGPAKVGVTEVASGGWVAKQTDPSLYTGAHKERFDAEGKGRGLAGRDGVKTGDLSELLDRTPADIRGIKK
eukprot:TRINITY_DN14729_c0_g1_i1.p1 TRINITY_DN14729_c0_g1~~TRINITY_DN14729_c0_g1_i1.p1  ORF type:complete len:167 (+),score=44.13 TRINITY_DN14729_c0_g1_i1:36-536(+)